MNLKNYPLDIQINADNEIQITQKLVEMEGQAKAARASNDNSRA